MSSVPFFVPSLPVFSSPFSSTSFRLSPSRSPRFLSFPSVSLRSFPRSRSVITCISPSPTSNPCILVIDHGSRRDASNILLSSIATKLQSRVSIPVHFAHMEIATPSIFDTVNECVQKGINHIIVVPYFLAQGRHIQDDIPNLVQQAVEQFHGVTFEICKPLADHPKVIDVLYERANETSQMLVNDKY